MRVKVFYAIAIVENQKVVYAKGFGVKNLANESEKVTPQSLFHMASVTKLLVATSVMQLAEKGKINLDASVVKYLPLRITKSRWSWIRPTVMRSKC